MVARSRIDSLIQYTIENRLIEALNEFYHPHTVMQENCQAPRVGLATSIARQQAAQNMTAKIHEVKAVSVVHEGDRVAIEWHADWTLHNGARVKIEEIALQLWDGDRIVHERFFYDPTAFVTAMQPTRAAARSGH